VIDHYRAFLKFAATMAIPSKDEGLVPFRLWSVQRYFIRELCAAIAQDQREIVVLKARQLGATTVAMAWDAYWCLRHPGMQGQFNSNADDNRDYFRDVLAELYRTLPAKFSYPLRLDNKHGMAWTNGSRLMFQVMARQGVKAGKMGRGRGLNYLHSTEMGEWENPEAIGSLRSAFSERHPARLAIWEGTAKGYNIFYDMWQEAETAITQHAIFLAWWRHEGYRLQPEVYKTDAKIFNVYWDGRLNADERAWQRELDRRYHVTLTPEQWAWRRWKLNEKFMGHATLCDQEFPTLPEHAFQASGQPFMAHALLAKLRDKLDDAPPATTFRYTFGPTIERTEVFPASAELAHLTVWEEPSPHAYYVVAADPAYGASPDSDRYICSVWRASRSSLVQVASFVATEIAMYQFAWVCCHLAGAYSRPTAPAFFILELNGPGQSVQQEIDRLMHFGWGTDSQPGLLSALGSIQAYVRRRPDSMGVGAAWQWRTRPNNKLGLFTRLRDLLLQEAMVVREHGLVTELTGIRQTGTAIGGSGRLKDDRVVTAALAAEMYTAQALPQLDGLPPAPEETPVQDMPPAEERAMQLFFHRIGVR
jgi:hypothetical protein